MNRLQLLYSEPAVTSPEHVIMQSNVWCRSTQPISTRTTSLDNTNPFAVFNDD